MLYDQCNTFLPVSPNSANVRFIMEIPATD